eukprot:scaffold1040_cov74-Isochrysis_galbana.AAC.2
MWIEEGVGIWGSSIGGVRAQKERDGGQGRPQERMHPHSARVTEAQRSARSPSLPPLPRGRRLRWASPRPPAAALAPHTARA